ncbi:MAG: hypothetical protein NVSMB52_05710 [Chloroflexota bacterium]
MLGARRLSYDHLVALLGVFTRRLGASELDSFTEIEAALDGWWYACVLPDGRLVVGYMTDWDNERAKIARSRDGFLLLLAQTKRLKEQIADCGYTLRGPIRTVAANSSHLDRTSGDGWCAVGDAAAAHDPLSSQGIVTALNSGLRAAGAISSPERGGLADYDEYQEDSFARYLAHWLGYYALESRWQTHEFWRRRHHMLNEVLGG